ncbi:MAG: hypothetical protein Q8R08_01945, partial [bacterium]|nr:hypothetical protein [bacterium]
DYLTQVGVAIAARTVAQMTRAVRMLINDKEHYQLMQKNMKALDLAKAAQKAAQTTIDILHSSINM